MHRVDDSTETQSATDRVEDMQQYYGIELETANDLRSSVCTVEEKPTTSEARAYARVHPEISARSYGCGVVLPAALVGARVLDIGCGVGRDVFMLAGVVGEGGHVTGIDATSKHIEFASSHIEWHMREYGYRRSNVDFRGRYDGVAR